MNLRLFVASIIACALSGAVWSVEPSDKITPADGAKTILGYPVDATGTAQLKCGDETTEWFFDLGDRYALISFITCEASIETAGFTTMPTKVVLYFHDGRVIGGDASFKAEDTRATRLFLRKWLGIPRMDDGRFLENELFQKDGFRYTFSYGGESDGLFVVEYLKRVREIADQKPRSDWDDHLDMALLSCTSALLEDAPGDITWPGRPHPWTYPYINRDPEGSSPTIYLTSHGAEYTDEFGFEQALPGFACSYDVGKKSARLTYG